MTNTRNILRAREKTLRLFPRKIKGKLYNWFRFVSGKYCSQARAGIKQTDNVSDELPYTQKDYVYGQKVKGKCLKPMISIPIEYDNDLMKTNYPHYLNAIHKGELYHLTSGKR